MATTNSGTSQLDLQPRQSSFPPFLLSSLHHPAHGDPSAAMVYTNPFAHVEAQCDDLDDAFIHVIDQEECYLSPDNLRLEATRIEPFRRARRPSPRYTKLFGKVLKRLKPPPPSPASPLLVDTHVFFVRNVRAIGTTPFSSKSYTSIGLEKPRTRLWRRR